MIDVQKITVELSKVKTRLNEIAGLEGDALTPEIRSESAALETEYADLEVRFRAATIAGSDLEAKARGAFAKNGDGESPEDRGLRQLTERANLGTIVSASVERRNTEGAEAELQQHYGLASNQFPLESLRLRPEERALTPAPTNVETDQDPIVAPVFANSAGAFMGVFQPTVAMGDAVYPVLTTRPSVGGPHSDDSDVAETTGSFDSVLLAPERIQASFLWKRVDAARFASMESSLRMALNEGLGEKADQEIVNGSKGLLNGTNVPNHNVSSVTSFASYLSQFCYGRVDGRYATDQSMLRILVGAGTYAHAGTVYRSNNADYSVLDSLMAKTGGVRVSAHVPSVASNKQNSVIRLGSRRDMVQALWNGVTIIVDEVTHAGKGEIEVTAVMLLQTQIIRAEAFYKQETKHA